LKTGQQTETSLLPLLSLDHPLRTSRRRERSQHKTKARLSVQSAAQSVRLLEPESAQSASQSARLLEPMLVLSVLPLGMLLDLQLARLLEMKSVQSASQSARLLKPPSGNK
jgi:hypothetical protein